MTQISCVYKLNKKCYFSFYVCIVIVVAASVLRETVADVEDDATKAPGTSGKKYQSAYHHVRPGHSGPKYSGSSDSSNYGLSWVKVLVIVVLVLCAILFIVVVCAYWSRNATEDAMTERQAAVTRFLKMQDQQV